MKRTKIVATLGPASVDKETLKAMLEAGLNVARLNFSHGSHTGHQPYIDAFRAASQEAGVSAGILQDLSGPKIRIGDFAEGTVELVPGEEFIITTDDCKGDKTCVSLTYKELPGHVKPGARILLNDGKNELRVTKVAGNNIHTEVIVGGSIKSRRGVNIPGAYLPIKSLTDKDREDVAFGIKNNVDFVGMSFVRTAGDIEELRTLLRSGNSKAQIIAKIETQEAMENLDAIIAATDGVMVARGDLAVEIPAEKVPLVQKDIIARCMRVGKPVIVATHMLESMINSPVPTRAEVSDVANAVLDGTDAIMLSAESALGEYPVEAVRTMAKIAETVEVSGFPGYTPVRVENPSSTDTVTEAVHLAARRGHVKYLVALTESGSTARMLARFRLPQDIIAFTPHAHVCEQLTLSYGCRPILTDAFTSLEEVTTGMRNYLLKAGIAQAGDTVVIAAGIPFRQKGSTNLLLLQTL